ncbi:hypothetical protein BDP27DRAFT_1365293 [Rhodocollybia butyracea]|uniref:Uncharacterized protein n=1 Tax=Rhodocollybia butyracea TaxID=206335 RepID=A0A9P5PN52_9AGAR|nr:hypothetical protein BDP27DRAFT_1365293 [Rhodocollybia butyracea]
MYDFLQSTVILETEFPALKSMTVVHSTAGRHPTEDSTLSSLMSISKKSMPKLEKFCLCGFNSAVIGHLTRTHSWSPNIKHLVLCSSSGMSVLDGWRLGPADILSILSQNPQLSSFHAAVTLNSDYRIYGLLQLSDSVFNLPSLLHLNLQFMVPPNDALHAHPDPDMHHLFKCISCPSLKTLSVAYAGVPSLTEVPFLPWLSDPKVSRIDKLRELNLSISMTPTALTECLILLPSSLRVLEIVDLGQIDVDSTGTMFGHTVRDSHLDLLTRNDSQDNSHLDVCPNLKIFRLIISRFLVSTCLTPRASDSDVSETQLKRKKNMGVSRAVLQRFIDSRTQSTGNGTRKARTIRECEVLLSPTSSTYYKLDSP